MPSSLVRKGIWAAAAIAVVAFLILAALPFIASTQIVRDRIAIEMSAWSGYRVELGAAPDIEFWPFRAILDNVTLSGWSDPSRKPVIVAETGMDWQQAAASKAMIADLLTRVSALGANGLGVLYWEPQAYPGWQGYTWGALDGSGRFTSAMDPF